MLPTNRTATHPGVFVRENLEEMEISQSAFAAHCGMPIQRLNEIVNGRRGISADTAWIFGQAFGTSPAFWMNAQAMYELTTNRPDRKIPPIKSRAA